LLLSEDDLSAKKKNMLVYNATNNPIINSTCLLYAHVNLCKNHQKRQKETAFYFVLETLILSYSTLGYLAQVVSGKMQKKNVQQ